MGYSRIIAELGSPRARARLHPGVRPIGEKSPAGLPLALKPDGTPRERGRPAQHQAIRLPFKATPRKSPRDVQSIHGLHKTKAKPAVEPVGGKRGVPGLSGIINIDSQDLQDLQDFPECSLSSSPEHPRARSGSSAEPTSRAGTCRHVYPVHPVHRC